MPALKAMQNTSTEPLPELGSEDAFLTVDRAQYGEHMEPLLRIRVMTSGQWERFTLEWAHSLKEDYAKVEQRGGSGDRGRDVVAHVKEELGGGWDNYQCKHYAHALAPSHAWVELGKVCYSAYTGAYSLPRRYYFVAPQYVGPGLSDLLDNPDRLKEGLLSNWDVYCKDGITSTKSIELDSPMRMFIEAMNFDIFQALPPLTMIEQHSRTRWHALRFGGGLPDRPPTPLPPREIEPGEAIYVRALYDAYEERLKVALGAIDELTDQVLLDHFNRCRREFYSAESLRKFSRDSVDPGTFEALMDDVYSGIVDVLESQHPDALERVHKVVAQAKALTISMNALATRLRPTDMGGICHQLANEEKLKWRR